MKVKNIKASLKKCLEKIKGRLEEVFRGGYSGFTKFTSAPEHLCILGNSGMVMGYRIRYNPCFLNEFATS